MLVLSVANLLLNNNITAGAIARKEVEENTLILFLITLLYWVYPQKPSTTQFSDSAQTEAVIIF